VQRLREPHRLLQGRHGARPAQLLDWRGALRQALQRIQKERRGKSLTTGEFFASLKRLFGQDFDWFASRFVRGVGMPTLYYRYEFIRKESGGWQVKVRLEQTPDEATVRQVVKRPQGATSS